MNLFELFAQWHAMLQKRFANGWRRNTSLTRNVNHALALLILLFSKLKVPFERAVPFVGSGYAAPSKCHQYGLSIHAKRFSHLFKRRAAFSKLYGDFQIPFFGSNKQVMANVLALSCYLKVPRVIVEAVFVFVVNDLVSCKRSAKNFFHDKSVLKALPSNPIDNDANQAISRFMARELTDVSARAGSSHSVLKNPNNNSYSSNQRTVFFIS